MNELEKAAERIALLYGKILDNQDWDMQDLDELLDLSFKDGMEWQAKQSPWISVEERLPEEYKEVLVRYKVCAETKYDVLFIYGSTSWCFADMEEYIDESMTVTHWMQIPE